MSEQVHSGAEQFARIRSGRKGVVAVIRREDRFLTIRRSALVTAPLRLCFPGGGIEAGETPREALLREMREELGVDVIAISSNYGPAIHRGELTFHGGPQISRTLTRLCPVLRKWPKSCGCLRRSYCSAMMCWPVCHSSYKRSTPASFACRREPCSAFS